MPVPDRPLPNMADVARVAGVSISTVSRALSGAEGVSTATRERIARIAEDLSYVISPDASRLASRRTRRVAVVVRDIETWFFYAILGAIEPVLRAAGFDVLFYRVASAEDRRAFFAELPTRRKVDAVILVAIPLTGEQIERLGDMGVPIVMAGSRLANYPCVHVDEVAIARQAVNHLVRIGHRRIAQIGVATRRGDAPLPNLERSSGYTQALAEAGLPHDPDLVISVDLTLDGGALAMDQLLSLDSPPTAVFAACDHLAFGAMRSLRRIGVSVPAKMSLVGVDDHPMATLSDLTTVRQPVHEMGATSAAQVVDILTNRPVPAETLLPTHLVVRGSTAPPPDTARSSSA